MINSVHYFIVEYSLPGDYDYKRNIIINLNSLYNKETELVNAIKDKLFLVEEITRNCNLENYITGILLLNKNLVGEFSFIDSEDEYYNSITLSIKVNIGIYDSLNNLLFSSDLLNISNY